MLYDTARKATATVRRRNVVSASDGSQTLADPTVVASGITGVVEDSTGSLRRQMEGTKVSLGLLFITEDRTLYMPGDLWTLTHQGAARQLLADTVKTYRRTQQINLIDQVQP